MTNAPSNTSGSFAEAASESPVRHASRPIWLIRIGPTRAIQPPAEADPIIAPRYTVAMNHPIALGETSRSRTATGAITGAQYTATATSVWIASVTASGVIQAASRALLR